jgi:hypothetical protein
MAYKVRRSSHGGDRRHGRSLIETLNDGNDTNVDASDAETYDETVGPRDMVRRPNTEEWGERAEGYRVFSGDSDDAEQVRMVFAANEGRSTGGRGKVRFTNWEEPEEVDEKLERKKWEKETGMSY